MTINLLSEKLLLAVKMQEPTGDLLAQLTAWPKLEESLTTDLEKKAFWINCYNAFFQILRKEKNIEKPAIYRDQFFSVAGQKISLDEIEHGILRRYRYKFSLGYLPNLLAPRWIKNLAVDQMDYRIHFALNCGAKSCPPIAFYSPDRLEAQLDIATLSFLEGETTLFPEKKEIHTSRLFQWFIGDFGGKRGVRNILQEKLKTKLSGFKLVYTEYSWAEELDNFS